MSEGRVRVLLFAAARDIVGRGEVELPWREGATVATVREALFARHPGIAGYERALRFAVNGEYARDDTAVGVGDEVAVIPPVAGG